MIKSRRDFLASTSCSLLGYSSIFSTLFNLKLAKAAAVDQSDTSGYKALVCIFMFGGNDSYNMLIPAESDEYKIYKAARGGLAIPLTNNSIKSALLLQTTSQDGRKFAVHPAMSELRDLYGNGQLAFLANTGTLVEPTTVKSYKNRSSKLPSALFSHNDQRDQWQTGLPQEKSKTGWLGRAVEQLESTETEKELRAISLNGNNLLQTGQHSGPFTITDNGGVAIKSTLASSIFDLFQSHSNSQNDQEISVFYREFLNSSRKSISINERFLQAFNTVTLPGNTIATSRLSESLDAVAKSIKLGKKFGLKRQTFFLLAPGWDNHQDLLTTHNSLLSDLSQSLGRFQQTINTMSMSDEVTTFSASDFARTLRSNGRGTDHAWGGNHFILGGAVKGGSIYGSYPAQLLINDGLDVGKNGRLLPTTSCDQYFAELLRWFGVPRNSLPDVLPNLGNFPATPLGFLDS